jgi:hypothetical protein
MTAEALYVVIVRDRVDERLAGHGCRSYASPPQPREHALALVGVLLAGAARPANGACEWTRPIAGGQRTITLAPARHVG